MRSTTFSKEKSNAQVQNKKLLARQKYWRRGAGLPQTVYESTTCHCCTSYFWGDLNGVLCKMQEEEEMSQFLKQVKEGSCGKPEDTFDPTSAWAGRQQIS